MFAIEVEDRGGSSKNEVLLVESSCTIMGNTSRSDIQLDDSDIESKEYYLLRMPGRRFLCGPITVDSPVEVAFSKHFRFYEGECSLSFGRFVVHIKALDSDLGIVETEPADESVLRILKRATMCKSPMFPAAGFADTLSGYVSIPEGTCVYVGRSKDCALSYQSREVSLRHARLGMDGGKLWIEDLDSTNGTYVNGERISNKTCISRGDELFIASTVRIMVVFDESQLEQSLNTLELNKSDSEARGVYPCVVSLSESVHPAHFVLGDRDIVSFGRDPENDIWIGASHISRRHCEIRRNADGSVGVIDLSSNGTFLDGERLPPKLLVPLGGELSILDFCAGVLLGVCWSEKDKQTFLLYESEEIPEVDGEDELENQDPGERNVEEGNRSDSAKDDSVLGQEKDDDDLSGKLRSWDQAGKSMDSSPPVENRTQLAGARTEDMPSSLRPNLLKVSAREYKPVKTKPEISKVFFALGVVFAVSALILAAVVVIF